MKNGSINIILVRGPVDSFRPGFRSCCQTRTVWTGGHVVCLVEFLCVALCACLRWSCCERWTLCSTIVASIKRHWPIEDAYSYSTTIPQEILPMWPSASLNVRYWECCLNLYTVQPCPISLPAFLSHGSFLHEWRLDNLHEVKTGAWSFLHLNQRGIEFLLQRYQRTIENMMRYILMNSHFSYAICFNY